MSNENAPPENEAPKAEPRREESRREDASHVLAQQLAAEKRRADEAEKRAAKFERDLGVTSGRLEELRGNFAKRSAVASIAPHLDLPEAVIRPFIAEQWAAVSGLERTADEDDDAYTERQIEALGKHLREKVPEVFRREQAPRPSTANMGNITNGRSAPAAPFNPYNVEIKR